MLIDFVPTVNGTSLADAPAFKKAPGGAPANVSAGLAKLGCDTAFLGKVGDDPFGHLMIQTLADEGVDTTHCLVDPTARTALAFVTLKADGEREFMFYRHPSADMLLTPHGCVHVLCLVAKNKIYAAGPLLLSWVKPENLRRPIEKFRFFPDFAPFF